MVRHIIFYDLATLKKRNVLTRLKQTRDAVRSDNLKLRQKGGLVAHKRLLCDFEEKIDEVNNHRVNCVMLSRKWLPSHVASLVVDICMHHVDFHFFLLFRSFAD